MNEIKVHAELLALRQLCAFLLAREMVRENNTLEDIHEAFVAEIIEVISTSGFPAAQEIGQQLEASVSGAFDQLFSMASGMRRSMQR